MICIHCQHEFVSICYNAKGQVYYLLKWYTFQSLYTDNDSEYALEAPAPNKITFIKVYCIKLNLIITLISCNKLMVQLRGHLSIWLCLLNKPLVLCKPII